MPPLYSARSKPSSRSAEPTRHRSRYHLPQRLRTHLDLEHLSHRLDLAWILPGETVSRTTIGPRTSLVRQLPFREEEPGFLQGLSTNALRPEPTQGDRRGGRP